MIHFSLKELGEICLSLALSFFLGFQLQNDPILFIYLLIQLVILGIAVTGNILISKKIFSVFSIGIQSPTKIKDLLR